MTFLNQILENSRLLLVLHDNLEPAIKSSELYGNVANYFEKYCLANAITSAQAVDIYTNYVVAYNKHCKQFVKTNKYPLELGAANYSATREEYDVVLLLSVLFTAHRFQIMQMIAEQTPTEKALFIGLGPGLELALTQKNHQEIHAYDLAINQFLYTQFSDVAFKNELYTGQNKNYFNTIYLIEILEHLSDPFALLQICSDSLTTGGNILLTTATDIPQYDHLFNFPDDHGSFDQRIQAMGFDIISKEKLEHNYLTMDLKPSNHFYNIIKK